MFIYNVTFGVDANIADQWLVWMKDHHIPDVLKTKAFESYKIYKVLTDDDHPETVSFAVQYFSASIGAIQHYLEKDAPKLREEGHRKWGDKQVPYRTLLEDVS